MDQSVPLQNEFGSSRRVLVFIVAYDAEKHIASVLERIDRALYNAPNIHFLIIDDASPDASASVARDWITEHSVQNVTILRNPVNQGYGGNQKLGYRMAIELGFDLVILLHGDGQYAPELLTKFIEIRQQQGADVILGSRMAMEGGAKKGGMPLYKLLGNRMLTGMQNMLTGQHLSEYHTGYRAYSTAFLKRVPFEINTNDFHFDTEILLQAFSAKAKVVEFPIPTHYGDEICHVDGMRYAKDVLVSTLQYAMQKYGMMCSLKYLVHGPTQQIRQQAAIYPAQQMALDTIEASGASHVLDIGGGLVGATFDRSGTNVQIQEVEMEAIVGDRRVTDNPVGFQAGGVPDPFMYGAVVLLDTLARLENPESLLLQLRNQSKALVPGDSGPTMIVSVPNVAFVTLRVGLLFGRFNYAERGILNIRHRRLFTRAAFERMLQDCGYVIERILPVPVPFETIFGGRAGVAMGRVASALSRLWPSMFAFQFLAVCHPMPGVRQILGQSESVLKGTVSGTAAVVSPGLERAVQAGDIAHV